MFVDTKWFHLSWAILATFLLLITHPSLINPILSNWSEKIEPPKNGGFYALIFPSVKQQASVSSTFNFSILK